MKYLLETVGSVVFNNDYLTDPSGTALAYWTKHGQTIAPNGSVMRTTPIGVICMDKSEDETFQAAISMGAITHADPRCALAVAIVSSLVRGLCRGEIAKEEDVDALLERAWTHVVKSAPSKPLDRAEYHKHVHIESLDALVLCDRTMGYVYKCLGSALWCLRQVLRGDEDFRSAMVKLVMCGGDADTNGAVAGALMGAHCGRKALPAEWRDGMRHKEWFDEKIEGLLVVSGLKDGFYDGKADSDTDFYGGKGELTEDEMKKREMAIMEKMLLMDKRRREAAEEKRKQEKDKKTWKPWA